MDDLCEHHYFSSDLNWSPYTYVSCWTNDDTENLALWQMYSNHGKGVRIAIDSDFIDWEKQELFLILSQNSFPLPPTFKENSMGEMRQSSARAGIQLNSIAILGPLNFENCYHSINYNFQKEISIDTKSIVVKKSFSKENFREFIGTCKKKVWECQNESRFIIHAVPYDNNINSMNLSYEEMINTIRKGIKSDILSIDLPIKEQALKGIKIMLGPNVPLGQYYLIKAFMESKGLSWEINGSVSDLNGLNHI